MECMQCDSDETTAATAAHELRIGDHIVAGRVPALRCVGCSELYIEIGDLDRFEREVAEAVLREGVVDGATFRFLRQTMGLTAKELAPMLATTPEAIAQWEKAVRPVERAAWLTLALLVADKNDGRARAEAIVAAAARAEGTLPRTIDLDERCAEVDVAQDA